MGCASRLDPLLGDVQYHRSTPQLLHPWRIGPLRHLRIPSPRERGPVPRRTVCCRRVPCHPATSALRTARCHCAQCCPAVSAWRSPRASCRCPPCHCMGPAPVGGSAVPGLRQWAVLRVEWFLVSAWCPYPYGFSRCLCAGPCVDSRGSGGSPSGGCCCFACGCGCRGLFGGRPTVGVRPSGGRRPPGHHESRVRRYGCTYPGTCATDCRGCGSWLVASVVASSYRCFSPAAIVCRVLCRGVSESACGGVGI